MKKILRASGKWTDILPVAVLLSIGVVIAGSLVSTLLARIIPVTDILNWITGDPDVSAFMEMYLSTIGVWLVLLPAVLCIRENRPMKTALGYNRRGNHGRGALIGLLLGFGSNALCVLISLLSGDIKLSYGGFRPVVLLAFLLVVLIQSGSEELVDRLYLYQKLRRRYKHPIVAVLGNALAFTLMHVFNPGFTLIAGIQIFVIGVIFSLLVFWYDSLWAAITFHTAWNFTQNILFGLPNSGIVSAYSLFRLEAASARNGLFYNVDFGIEGSIGSSLILILMAAAIFLVNRKKPERNDVWAGAEAAAMGVCLHCGAVMEEKAVFCPQCGQKR